MNPTAPEVPPMTNVHEMPAAPAATKAPVEQLNVTKQAEQVAGNAWANSQSTSAPETVVTPPVANAPQRIWGDEVQQATQNVEQKNASVLDRIKGMFSVRKVTEDAASPSVLPIQQAPQVLQEATQVVEDTEAKSGSLPAASTTVEQPSVVKQAEEVAGNAWANSAQAPVAPEGSVQQSQVAEPVTPPKPEAVSTSVQQAPEIQTQTQPVMSPTPTEVTPQPIAEPEAQVQKSQDVDAMIESQQMPDAVKPAPKPEPEPVVEDGVIAQAAEHIVTISEPAAPEPVARAEQPQTEEAQPEQEEPVDPTTALHEKMDALHQRMGNLEANVQNVHTAVTDMRDALKLSQTKDALMNFSAQPVSSEVQSNPSLAATSSNNENLPLVS